MWRTTVFGFVALATVVLGVPRLEAEWISLSVVEPTGIARTDWPVTSGIPIGRGELTDPGSVRLFTEAGKPLPLQTRLLGSWPDGSVRWLLLDFQATLAPHQRRIYQLTRLGKGDAPSISQPVASSRARESVGIETGRLRVEIPFTGFRMFDRVWLDNRKITQSRESGIELTDSSGGHFNAANDRCRVVVEENGPLRVCVRIDGRLSSDAGSLFRYVVRLHAYAGKPYIRSMITLVNDCQDSVMADIDSMDVHLSPMGSVAGGLLDGKRVTRGRLFQWDDQHYRVDDDERGRRGSGWAAVEAGEYGMAVGLRQFWQNWPKGIALGKTGLSMEVLPSFPNGQYDGHPLELESKLYYYLRKGTYRFKCGAARTHELWTTFFQGPAESKSLTAFFQAAEKPLLATCAPDYACRSLAFGEFPKANVEKYAAYDKSLEQALNGHLQRQAAQREYGMLNFGDWYGERSVNWGNLEYDLAHGLFQQYVRTGDRRFFDRAEQAARHHIDMDIVHATNPLVKNPWGEPPRVGDIWLHAVGHTGGYYEKAPLPVDRTYQMGHSTNFGHVWISGDLDYYHLTGDRRAFDVSLEAADAMVSHMPTSYGTHIRSLGWPLLLVLDAYEATGDKKYLNAARANWLVLKKNIDWQRGWVVRLAKGHCLHDDRHCEGNVPFMEGLTLSALSRYHRITEDPEVLRAISVGIDQMIRECWQEEAGTFSYTPCPLSSRTPYVLFLLSAQAMAYEVRLTGNDEHLRILRRGVRAAIRDGNAFGKNLAQMIFFTPHALSMLD